MKKPEVKSVLVAKDPETETAVLVANRVARSSSNGIGDSGQARRISRDYSIGRGEQTRSPHGEVTLPALRSVGGERRLPEVSAQPVVRCDRYNRKIKNRPSQNRSSPAHRFHQPCHFSSHLLGRQMHFLPVTRQYPLEPMLCKPCHRLGLLAPRVPAVAFRGRERLGRADDMREKFRQRHGG